LHDAIAAFIREAEAHLDDGRREAATSRVLEDAAVDVRKLFAEQVEARREADRASLARALNDLESAKARVERDAKARASELREKIVLDLLPVLDNLDRTIAAAAQSGGEVFGLIEGVRLTLDQFLGILMRFGIERIESKHLPFDPKLHDAISVVTVGTEGWHNKVLDQIEPGYRYGDKLIRPAKVVVGRHE
jgi:molecular chaperone GrpE